MADNKKLPHLFLKNQAATAEKFKKNRGWETKAPEEEKEKDYTPLKDRLQDADRIFKVERRTRHNKRTISVPEHIDQVRIHFFKVFNNSLQKEFIKRYGLQPLSFYDFNKTVLFAIDNEELFKVFQSHLEQFYNSSDDHPYQGQEYNLIALIFHFECINSRKIINAYDERISSFNLIPPYSLKADKIFKALNTYLQEKKIKFIYQSESNAIEIYELPKEQIDLITDNFDIIQSVQSTRAGKVRPGRLGNVIRNFGIEIIPNKNAPLVGVIDTGVQNIDPLKPVLADFNYDLTGTAATWDSHGHGTMVAGLVAMGVEYFTDVKEKYQGKAFIVPIKVLTDSEGNFSYNDLVNTIEDAYKKGVRLFNLSVNHLPKRYNSIFSNYAYLLDLLSYRNDLLIFISCGNIDYERVEELYGNAHNSHTYPNYFYCLDTDSPFHRCETTNICTPSESMNNVTVGALAENFTEEDESGITPAKEYPASYTRKFHIDYNQQINGTDFSRNQKNKNLIKPDMTFAGGDLLNESAGLEVFSIKTGEFYTRNAGSSFSTPLVTSLAAEILTAYPRLKTQTVKALLINASNSACGNNPPAFTEKGLLRRLIGNGTPDRESVLYSNENSITFVIEDVITIEEFKLIKIKLPEYLNPNIHKSSHKLKVVGTLCYKFPPVKDNHLSYCPLHISFGIFKPDVSDMAMKKTEDYKIKTVMTWSEDFFGIENRLLSNVQKIDYNLQPEDIGNVNNEISIAVRCTNKDEIDGQIAKNLAEGSHEFSLALTFIEMPSDKTNTNRLYNELSAINTVEVIGDIQTDIDIELGE
ncbi:MAG: S8 family serine peptidase [Bacteroidota bacterium]